ncbi:hypothetical protein [Streptomyces scabiei]|uniref:hypothetical protein n=1 Tax=Streptomyces scabiei TaxID=1930 RepID=UPI001B3239A8
MRLRTLEDLFAYVDSEGVDLRIDGTEVQVRRSCAQRPGRKAYAPPLAIAAPVSDRPARQATRRKWSTELVLARPHAC